LAAGSAEPGMLRVVDAGVVPALRSQALWHGIADAMPAGAGPTLSFCRSSEPYVGIGFHRDLVEIDLEHCSAAGYRVIRRQIGGGPVLVDGDQLLFQVTLPAEQAPPRVDRLFAELLAPAVRAFEALGVPARLSGLNDIAIAGRKLSGTGAGRIGEAVTVVGNVIFRFPHERMARVLALPSASVRDECLELMRRHVSSLAGEGKPQVTVAEARQRLIDAYATALGRKPRPASLAAAEEESIRDWERRFEDPVWRAGAPSRPRPHRTIKISATAWLYLVETAELSVEMSVVEGAIARLRVRSASLNGDGERVARAIEGLPADAELVARRLESLGAATQGLAERLTPGLSLEGAPSRNVRREPR